MTGTTIKTTITAGITLGSGGYNSPLTLTASGRIDPAGYGVTGIYVPVGKGTAQIINHGAIGAGIGADGSGNGPAGYGGTAIFLDSKAKLANTGGIYGGLGGDSAGQAGSGGVGVNANAVGVIVSNTGKIFGGGGGYGYATPGSGGAGIYLADQGMLTNSGTITGGNGGQTFLDNSVSFSGGGETFYGYGGTGLVTRADGDKITNTGIILGGAGGYAGNTQTGIGGGFGADIYGATKFTNKGMVVGGAGGSGNSAAYGGDGGGGLYIGQGASLLNTGTIIGGYGGYGDLQNGTSGAGLYAFYGVTVTNEGLIAGQDGLSGHSSYAGSGGNGARELYGVLLNKGIIQGGDGGSSLAPGGTDGFGANGVYMEGGTLINAGTISGGIGGISGAAVYLGRGIAGTVIVDPGAVFNGFVRGNSNAADVLEVSGKSKLALTGIGTQFVDFNTMSFATGAAWVVAGNQDGLASGETISGFTSADKLDLTFLSFSNKDKVSVATAGVVTIKAGSTDYTLDITGATKGESDFKLTKDANGDTYLTKTGSATALPSLAEAGGWTAMAPAAPAAVHGAAIKGIVPGSMQESLARDYHRGIETMVTLAG